MEQPSHTAAAVGIVPSSLAVEASVTLVAALFSLLALDDITTDNATTGFKPEYRLLAVCGAWLLLFVLQLWRTHRRTLAAVSLALVAAAAWVVSDGLGHKNAGGWSVFWAEYSLVTIAWLWFTAVSVTLLARAFRGVRSGDASV